MVGLQKRGRWNQDSTLTLKLRRQAPDGTFLLNDLEEGSVPLLLDHCQLCNHHDTDNARPCDHS
jgi:hypothetical protein